MAYQREVVTWVDSETESPNGTNSVVYKGQGSCVGVDSILNGTKLTE